MGRGCKPKTRSARKTGGNGLPAPRFELGRVALTANAAAVMDEHGIDPNSLLRRHVSGDWGDMPEEDKLANEHALETGARIFSGYVVDGIKFWVITDAATDACSWHAVAAKADPDCATCGGTGSTGAERRRTTTILLPSDY